MRNGRLGLVAILLVALLLAGVTRYGADRMRAGRDEAARTAAGQSNLSQMNSFALGLLLGGLRGPLVMMLWTTSEAQKTERQLEDFDTKVEWIRLLQPEFDTVHLFQIWNKAYNISVQMASLANKYITILDAIDYAHRVDAERPNNINILSAIGGIYFDKLGNSAERHYFRRRVREETQARDTRQEFDRNDPRFRRLRHDTLLDPDGNILPEYRQSNAARRLVSEDGTETMEGAELEFLAKFEPFPYGVSPMALGYNYHKRAQMLQRIGQQRHAQLSDIVIDSRPAIALKGWAEEEWELGRRLELQALGIRAPMERLDLELPAADVPLDAEIKARQDLEQAIHSYARCADLVRDTLGEYAEHLKRFMGQPLLYQSHQDTVTAMGHLARGDEQYLRLMLAPQDQRQQLTDAARDSYRKAITGWQLMILKYYTTEMAAELAFPEGVTKLTIQERVPPEEYDRILSNVLGLMQTQGVGQEYIEDITEYLTYMTRAQQRLAQLPQS